MIMVGIGGIAGAIIRFQLSKLIAAKANTAFPLATWLINISGSFALGWLARLHLDQAVAEWVWLLFGVGFLGAYTTFSTFGYETVQLLEQKKLPMAALYVLTSVLLGILFAWIGALAGQFVG